MYSVRVAATGLATPPRSRTRPPALIRARNDVIDASESRAAGCAKTRFSPRANNSTGRAGGLTAARATPTKQVGVHVTSAGPPLIKIITAACTHSGPPASHKN